MRRLKKAISGVVALAAVVVSVAICADSLGAAAGAEVNANEMGGVATSARGPEAGVWVIAETTQLPTRFAKIVVTDDQGRYLIPKLPRANYSVWVRGYGLSDSAKVHAAPGSNVNLTAVTAPNAARAAEV